LFDGDHEKVKKLNELVCTSLGFEKWVPVSGQTYSRKIDYRVLSALSSLAQSANKMAGDIRLLASMKQVEEPFGKDQIGSSAMAYKRNPMRSERVCSLARYLMSLPQVTLPLICLEYCRSLILPRMPPKLMPTNGLNVP
jgi:adenylosuccinate lyase